MNKEESAAMPATALKNYGQDAGRLDVSTALFSGICSTAAGAVLPLFRPPKKASSKPMFWGRLFLFLVFFFLFK